MNDDLERAFQFMRQADMFGTSVEHTAYGIAVRSEEVPLRQDSNYLLADPTPASAAEIAREVERLSLRAVLVRDEATAERLEREFDALDWLEHRGLVMARRRPSERTADLSLVTEVDAETLARLRRPYTLAQPWGTPELADQQLVGKRLLAQRVDARFLAVLREGEVLACADLYLGEDIAQIEDVLTVEEHRSRGYASALVLYGVGEAERHEASLTFLVADAYDWPKLWYERLGFESIGRYWKFFT